MLLDILLNAQSSKTITEISEKMYLSQSYVSRLIKKKELEYGVELISRQSLPIHLTAEGKVLLDDMREIYQAQKTLEQHVKLFQHTNKLLITIAVTQPVAGTLLPKIFGQLQCSFPDLTFKFVDFKSDISEEALLSNQVDLLVGKKWNNPAFTILELATLPLSLLIPDTCPLFREERKQCPFTQDNLTALNKSRYIGLSGNSFLQRKVDQIMSENGISVRTIMEFPDYISALQAAIETKATTITTTSIAEQQLATDSRYNLMELPTELIHIDIAVSFLTNSSDKVKIIGQTLSDIAQVSTKQGETE